MYFSFRSRNAKSDLERAINPNDMSAHFQTTTYVFDRLQLIFLQTFFNLDLRSKVYKKPKSNPRFKSYPNNEMSFLKLQTLF